MEKEFECQRCGDELNEIKRNTFSTIVQKLECSGCSDQYIYDAKSDIIVPEKALRRMNSLY